MRPGDLIAFDSSDRVPGADHVGICTGNGQMIDAPHTGATVRIATVKWNQVVGVARPG